MNQLKDVKCFLNGKKTTQAVDVLTAKRVTINKIPNICISSLILAQAVS